MASSRSDAAPFWVGAIALAVAAIAAVIGVGVYLGDSIRAERALEEFRRENQKAQRDLDRAMNSLPKIETGDAPASGEGPTPDIRDDDRAMRAAINAVAKQNLGRFIISSSTGSPPHWRFIGVARAQGVEVAVRCEVTKTAADSFATKVSWAGN